MSSPIAGSSKCKWLYDIFIGFFPDFANRVTLYGPFDRQSIKVDTYEHQSFIFTYINEKDWALRTYKNYLSRV